MMHVVVRDGVLRCEVWTVSYWEVFRHKILHGPLSASHRVSEGRTHTVLSSLETQTFDLVLCFSYSCHGKAVVKQGNTSSDTLCEEGVVNSKLLQDTTKGYQPGTLFSTSSTIRSTVLAISDATLSVSATVSNEVFYHSTTSQPPYKPPGISLGMIIDLL